MPAYSKPHGDFQNQTQIADATQVNDQVNQLYTAINGGLDGTNVPNLGDMTTVTTTAKNAAGAINELQALPVSSVARQAVINGNFAVNQRVVSGTVTLASGAYGHDRWKAGASGCTYTFATVNNVTTITITAGSLVQVIEGNNLFSGTYTLSWIGTAQGKIGAGSYGASGITGTATGGTNLSVEFNAGTLSKVGFNMGSVALPFQPRSFAEELALCQRYYEKSYAYSTLPGASAAGGNVEYKVVPSNTIPTLQAYGKVSYKTKKRTTPTVNIYSYTSGTVSAVSNANGGDLPANTGGVINSGDDGFAVFNNSGSSQTTTNNAIIFHWASDAEI